MVVVVVLACCLGAGLLNRYGHGCVGRFCCWWCCGCCGCGGWISAKLVMVVVVAWSVGAALSPIE